MQISAEHSGCCKKVRPENAARVFSHPASILFNRNVVEMLSIRKRILEVGAGCLRNALYLIRMGHSVTVLEVPRMRARFPDQYRKLETRGGKVVEAWSARPSFEIVISTFVIETICKPSVRTALLREIYRHMTSDGALILSARGPRDLLTAQNKGVWCGDGFLTPNLSFARSYTRAQMDGLLRNVGFSNLTFLHKSSSKEPEYLHVVARKTNERQPRNKRDGRK
jgi:hypothetical protein